MLNEIKTVHRYAVELDEGTKEVRLPQALMHQDAMADEFRVGVSNGGTPINLNGMAVHGYLYFSATQTTILLEGSTSGSEASVVLDEACYATPGYASLVIQLQQGDVRHTVLRVNLCIQRTGTENVIDPGDVLPSLAELLAQIDAMEAATEEARQVVKGAMVNRGYVANDTDLNTVTANGLYYLVASYTYPNSPNNSMGLMHVFDRGDGLIVQDYTAPATGHRWTRYRNTDGTWSEWKITDGSGTSSGGGLTPLVGSTTDITPAQVQEAIHAGRDIVITHTDSVYGPVTFNFFVDTPALSVVGASGQALYNTPDRRTVVMGYELLGVPSNGRWAFNYYELVRPEDIAAQGALINRKAISSNDADFNDIVEDGIYYAYTPNAHRNSPDGGPGLLTVTTQGSVITQDWVNIKYGTRSARYNYNGTWYSWNTGSWRDNSAVYYAFGDSTTWGQLPNGSQSVYNYPAYVGGALEMVVKNKGVPGQSLIVDWDTIHTDFINGLDMSDAALISVGWAYNTPESVTQTMNFGAASDTTPDTFVGKYYTIMKEFQEKCPQAQVVLITGYGMAGTTYAQFTSSYAFADGNKTIQTMYNTLEEMCHRNGWCCINQAKGCWVNRLNWSTYIGDEVHPNSNGYARYGDFLAAKMKAIYGNMKKW